MRCPKCHSDNPSDSDFCSKCGTQLLPAEEISAPTETLEAAKEELTTGSTFAGRYQIIEELGKGGMGKVYKAHDTEIKEKVALKLIKPEIAADKKTIERFQNELKFARRVSHRNVCRMYDLNKEESSYYITMEYVSGEDLKSLVSRVKQLTVGTAISIAKEVCEGLTEAHRLGVVHRDLKPQNIMIDKEGNVRIMDFGIARSITGKGITGAGVMIGTPEYMSPEQVEGKEADQRSDIYSLGVILYEMVTGRVPFEGETPLSIAVRHKTEEPKEPRELNTQIPEELSRVILRCMEKDKEKRYQSAGEVRSELENIEKGIPTTERIVPKRKPITSREITVTFGLKKLFIPALVVVALAVAAVIIWQVLPKKEAIPIPSDKPSLAVMYFENNTGDESLDHWRKALSDLLITDLTQSKYLRVLSGESLFNILTRLNKLEAKSYSSKDLEEVAARGGVEHILVGKLAKAGEAFRIDIILQEAKTGQSIGSERVEGKGEESIFSMVDELTKRIKSHFKLSSEEIASDIDRSIGKITTSSPEAYKYFSQSMEPFNKGEYREAIQLLEKAVLVDPEFATAYSMMSAAYSNLGYEAEGKKYIQKALELSERVSDRERYAIQGDFYFYSEKTYGKAIEAFKTLLQLYPEDGVGNNELGLLYLFTEQWDKAIERFEVIIKGKGEFSIPYGNQADAYMAKGLYDKARKVLEDYLNKFPDIAPVHRSLAYNYMQQGKFDLAFSEVEKAFSLSPAHYRNFVRKGDILLYTGDLIKAEKEYKKLFEAEEKATHLSGLMRLGGLYLLEGRYRELKNQMKQGIELAKELGDMWWKSDLHLLLAYMHLNSGNPQEALKECNKAWNSAEEIESLSLQRLALHYKGLTCLEMRSMEKAQRAADELKELIQTEINSKAIRYHLHLLGMIELKKENFSKAIENFKKAISLLHSQYSSSDDHALFIEPLASAYYKSEDLEKAREEYERITKLTTGRFFYGDIYAKSFYMLGKIFEQKGWQGKAIEHYEKFLALWRDADPGIPEAEDAKKRLSTLTGVRPL